MHRFVLGHMVMFTSPEDPLAAIGRLKKRDTRSEGLMHGYYRMAGNQVSSVGNHYFFSPPVGMHGELLCILCLDLMWHNQNCDWTKSHSPKRITSIGQYTYVNAYPTSRWAHFNIKLYFFKFPYRLCSKLKHWIAIPAYLQISQGDEAKYRKVVLTSMCQKCTRILQQDWAENEWKMVIKSRGLRFTQQTTSIKFLLFIFV